MLLEFYLTQLPPSVGIGAVRSLALVDVFVCLARFQVALPGKLAETIYRILLQIGVLPRIRYYQTQPSKLARLGQQHFRMIGIVGPSDRQKVGDLSQFLKTMREKLPPARI
jgi:uncharacterized protein YecE (DUF72 family)